MNLEDLGAKLSRNEAFAYNTLSLVFPYLNFGDLLNCSQVCETWRWIISSKFIWKNISVYACFKHIKMAINAYGPNIRRLEILSPMYIPQDGFLELICLKNRSLKHIALHGCNIIQLHQLAEHHKNLEEIYAEINWGEVKTLDFMVSFIHLTRLTIIAHTRVEDGNFLLKLKHLKHLALFAPCKESVWSDVVKIEGLGSLNLITDLESTWISELFETKFLIKHLTNLRKLQITNLPYIHEYDILEKVALLPNIKELSLENVSISRAGRSNFNNLLAKCKNLEFITLSINRAIGNYLSRNSASILALEDLNIFTGLHALRDNLKRFCWIIDDLRMKHAMACDVEYKSLVNGRKLFSLESTGNSAKLFDMHDHLKQLLPNTEVVLLYPATVSKNAAERCCFKCKKMIMTPQDRMKDYS